MWLIVCSGELLGKCYVDPRGSRWFLWFSGSCQIVSQMLCMIAKIHVVAIKQWEVARAVLYGSYGVLDGC